MDRPDAPAPMRRRGPRPLWLHLTLATQPSIAWLTVLQSLSGSLGAAPASVLVPAGAPGPDHALLAGIAAYRRHAWHRRMAEPPAIWAEGSSRLLDYGQEGGDALLVVPSLVNRASVLDLMPGHSMLRYLGGQGVRPLLLDWGYPDAAERGFSLSDYIAGRLERALEAVGGPVTLAGYCMGGLMAVAAALRRPDLVHRLVLLASPWDFWAGGEAVARQGRDIAAMLPALETLMAPSGSLPVDALQSLFSLLDPGSVAAKYRDFGRQDQASARARQFVAIEDWLNDGVPLAAAVARETIGGWYGRNTPAGGDWRVLGLPVDPRALRVPCFVAAPTRDRIVPLASARALAERIPSCVLHVPQAGHIGMVAGSTARAALWDRLVAWLRETRPA